MGMKEAEFVEKQKILVNEAITKINKSLVLPCSLRVGDDGVNAFYEMASGIIDESGGGSIHDVDYYTFPAEALNNLILIALVNGKDSGEVITKGSRYTDYVDWPQGRVDGSEIHRDNEQILLHLKLEIKDGNNILVISESTEKREYPICPKCGFGGKCEHFYNAKPVNSFDILDKYTFQCTNCNLNLDETINAWDTGHVEELTRCPYCGKYDS
jgi:DNA-directed RNA polymerase subunit RPC12/RpoP